MAVTFLFTWTHQKSDKILKGFCFPEVRKWSRKSDLHTSVSHTPGYHGDCWKTAALRFCNLTFTSTTIFLPKTRINWIGHLLLSYNSSVTLVFMAKDTASSLYFKLASGNKYCPVSLFPHFPIFCQSLWRLLPVSVISSHRNILFVSFFLLLSTCQLLETLAFPCSLSWKVAFLTYKAGKL